MSEPKLAVVDNISADSTVELVKGPNGTVTLEVDGKVRPFMVSETGNKGDAIIRQNSITVNDTVVLAGRGNYNIKMEGLPQLSLKVDAPDVKVTGSFRLKADSEKAPLIPAHLYKALRVVDHPDGERPPTHRLSIPKDSIKYTPGKKEFIVKFRGDSTAANNEPTTVDRVLTIEQGAPGVVFINPRQTGMNKIDTKQEPEVVIEKFHDWQSKGLNLISRALKQDVPLPKGQTFAQEKEFFGIPAGVLRGKVVIEGQGEQPPAQNKGARPQPKKSGAPAKKADAEEQPSPLDPEKARELLTRGPSSEASTEPKRGDNLKPTDLRLAMEAAKRGFEHG